MQPWYSNIVIYSVEIEKFCDSSGDGIGDIQGLITKLDYIKDLGVNCLWVLPFFCSPNRDNGFDITDYYHIDSHLGSLNDFHQLVREAKRRSINIIIDLVVNHTSIDHPWFQEARKNQHSPYRDYYIWSQDPPQNKDHQNIKLILPGEEDNLWTYDSVADSYYLHRFYHVQPDLNISNPLVKKEILKIIRFWLDQGVMGFRVDAASILVETFALPHLDPLELFHFLNEMRKFIDSYNPDQDYFLLGEANVSSSEFSLYYDQNKRLHSLFNFLLNQKIFYGLATSDSAPIINALSETINQDSQDLLWVNFLRNHDELNMGHLTLEEKEKVFAEFAPDESMRIYNHGIRRRLSPIVKGNIQQIKMLFTLIFTLPGIPMIRYGDEIGMGEDLSLPGRDSIRTCMQWTDQPSAGFSTLSPQQILIPLIQQGSFSHQFVNVEKSKQNSNSIYYHIKKLIKVRLGNPHWVNSKIEIIESSQEHILIFILSEKAGEERSLMIFNLANVTTSLNIPWPQSLQKDFLQIILKTSIEENTEENEEKSLSQSLSFITKKNQYLHIDLLPYDFAILKSGAIDGP